MPNKKEKSRLVREPAVLADDPNQHAESVASGCVEPDCNRDEVAALAFKMWQERGCPIGSDQEDWFRAENELKNSRTMAAACS